MATAEERIDGCVAYTLAGPLRRLRRDVRQPVELVALLDSRRTGVVVSSILHRDQARVYVKQVRDGELRARALARGAGGDRDARDGRRARAAPDAGRLPRARGHLQRGGAAGLRAGRESRRSPTPTIYEAVMAVQDGDGRPRRRADRELARGRGDRHARRAGAARPTDVRIVGRGGAPDPPLPGGARASCDLDEVDAGGLAPAGHRPVRALPARAAAAARSASRRPPPPRRCDGAPRPTSRWAALGSRLAAELYGCRVLAEDVEDHPDNVTRFVWLAAGRRGRPSPGGRPRPRSSSGASTTSRRARSSTCCASSPTAA